MLTTSDVTPYYGTECVGDTSALTLEQRLTRCYELAGYAIVLGTAPDEAILIHGTMHARLPHTTRIGHAWLELPNSMIWEPVSRQLWQLSAWKLFTRQHVMRQYTQSDVR